MLCVFNVINNSIANSFDHRTVSMLFDLMIAIHKNLELSSYQSVMATSRDQVNYSLELLLFMFIYRNIFCLKWDSNTRPHSSALD